MILNGTPSVPAKHGYTAAEEMALIGQTELSLSVSGALSNILRNTGAAVKIVIDPLTGRIYTSTGAEFTGALTAAGDEQKTISYAPDPAQEGRSLTWSQDELTGNPDAGLVAALADTVAAKKPAMSVESFVARQLAVTPEGVTPPLVVIDQEAGTVTFMNVSNRNGVAQVLDGVQPTGDKSATLTLTPPAVDNATSLKFEGGAV